MGSGSSKSSPMTMQSPAAAGYTRLSRKPSAMQLAAVIEDPGLLRKKVVFKVSASFEKVRSALAGFRGVHRIEANKNGEVVVIGLVHVVRLIEHLYNKQCNPLEVITVEEI